MKSNIFMTGVFIVIASGGGFFGGIKYQEMKNLRSGDFQRVRNGQFRERMQGFIPVNGEIISSEENNMTVKLQDGSSKIIILSNSTISASAQGSKADLVAGARVVVIGTENSDGSITAQNIQLNPIFGQNTGRQSTAPGMTR